MNRKKVMIMGAGGFLGSSLCSFFKSQDWEVHGMGHSSLNEGVLSFCDGSLTAELLSSSDRERIAKYIKKFKIRYLVYAIGKVDYKTDFETLYQTNVETAMSLVELFELIDKLNIKLDKAVYVSSSAARGFRGSCRSMKPLNEEINIYMKGISLYSDVKRMAEDVILSFIKRTKLPLVIVQPASLVGVAPAGNTTTTELVKGIMKGAPVLQGGASYVSVKNVVSGIASALERGRAGETYILGGENLKMKEFAEKVRTVVKDRKLRGRISSLPVITLPTLLAYIITGFTKILNREQTILGTGCHFVDSTKAVKNLGYRHNRNDLDDAVVSVIESL